MACVNGFLAEHFIFPLKCHYWKVTVWLPCDNGDFKYHIPSWWRLIFRHHPTKFTYPYCIVKLVIVTGFHSGIAEVSGHLGCNTVLLSEHLVHFSPVDKGIVFLQSIRNHSPSDTALHLRRPESSTLIRCVLCMFQIICFLKQPIT